MADALYFVPTQTVFSPEGGSHTGPKYFAYLRDGTGTLPDPTLSFAWYGASPVGLCYVFDILPASDAFLQAQSDTYKFDLTSLDVAISDKAALTAILEPANLPVQWTTASTTYRELIKRILGLARFSRQVFVQHHEDTGIVLDMWDGGDAGSVTLDDNWNDFTTAMQTAINTVLLEKYEWPSGVPGNPVLRSLVNQAASWWDTRNIIWAGRVW